MNKILLLSFVSVSLTIVCLISTNLIFNIVYAEIFEFNKKDYDYSSSSSDNDPLNSGEKQKNSEDTVKEN
jgi:hypothetical protein